MRAKYRARQAELYMERKIAGLCTRCGKPAADGVQQCEEHIKDARRRTREAAVKRRTEYRLKGLCANGCGTKTQRYYCLACLVKIGRFSSDSVNTTVDKSPAEERFRRHDDGRTRYHGQGVRGRQPVSQLDEQDLESAVKQIAKAKASLAIVHSPAVQDLPRIQREAAKREALALLGHAGRFLDEILDRHKMGGTDMVLMDLDENRRRGGR